MLQKAMIAGATFHESWNGSGDAGRRSLTGSITRSHTGSPLLPHSQTHTFVPDHVH